MLLHCGQRLNTKAFSNLGNYGTKPDEDDCRCNENSVRHAGHVYVKDRMPAFLANKTKRKERQRRVRRILHLINSKNSRNVEIGEKEGAWMVDIGSELSFLILLGLWSSQCIQTS